MIEIWKDIAGFEGLYQVSNLGKIKSFHKDSQGKIMRLNTKKDGYKQIHLCSEEISKKFYVHRLVADAFVLNPYNLPQINHKDEVRHNNHFENLEWCSPKYNVNYGNCRERISISKINHPNRSKSVNQYSKDGIFITKYESTREAERKTNISQALISACCRGKKKYAGEYIWKFAI